jgi:hypothetical protein
MRIHMFDPLDDSVIYSNYNTAFVAVHAAKVRHDLSSILLSLPLKIYDANRRPNHLVEDLSIPCLVRFFDQAYFESIIDALFDRLSETGNNIPHFVLCQKKPEYPGHPDVHYFYDISPSDASQILCTAARKAKNDYIDEIQTPQTKEFVTVSIHDDATLEQITNTIIDLGGDVFDTNIGDEHFDYTIVNNAFIRIIDTKTLEYAEIAIKKYLDRNADTAYYLVIGDSPLPFTHPRLLRYQDVTSEWIANEIEKGKEWDESEHERYCHEILEADE